MANRYLRATGNWNGAVWAATPSGAAGSAPTPTASDDVYIAANFTVTLTADAVCASFSHTNGTLNLSRYTLTVGTYASGSFQSSGSSARTLNFSSGKLIASGFFSLMGSNLTFIAGSSVIELTFVSPAFIGDYFQTLSKTFNDVILNIGHPVSTSQSTTVYITGSPTFRSLIIQSKNSAAHTVNFDDGAVISTKKIVAIGSSSSNKLTLTGAANGANIDVHSSSYGQNVAMNNVFGNRYDMPDTPLYIGSGSTDTTGDWLLQDPPKISTLVDPLTTAPGSNPNWTVGSWGTLPTLTSTGAKGGGYAFNGNRSLVSTDTYDFIGSSIVVELPSSFYGEIFFDIGGEVLSNNYTSVISIWANQNSSQISFRNPFSWTDFGNAPIWFKVSISESGVVTGQTSNDGLAWSTASTIKTLSSSEIQLYRSSRIFIRSRFYDYGNITIGSINPELAAPSNANFLQFF